MGGNRCLSFFVTCLGMKHVESCCVERRAVILGPRLRRKIAYKR